MAQERLDELTVAELRARAAELDISGRSGMAKPDLVEAIREADARAWSPPFDSETSASSEPESEADNDSSRAPDGEKPASEITAPSIGPNTVIEKKPPEERLDQDKISDVDAMGLDKRRSVVGHSYSASLGKQVVMYGIFLAVVVALLIGGKALVDEADAPPADYEAKAPWAQPEAEPVPPDPLQ